MTSTGYPAMDYPASGSQTTPFGGVTMETGLVFTPPPCVLNRVTLLRRLGALAAVAATLITLGTGLLTPSPSLATAMLRFFTMCVIVALTCSGLSAPAVAQMLASSSMSVTSSGFLPSMRKGREPVPWPDSRSGLYPVLRTGLGQAVVEARVVDASGREQALPGLTHVGPKQVGPQLVQMMNAQLDAVWAWGVARRATTESGRYTPVRLPAREKLRRRTARHLQTVPMSPGPGWAVSMAGPWPAPNNGVMSTETPLTAESLAAALGSATAEEALVLTPPSRILHEVTHLRRRGAAAAALALAVVTGTTYMWATVGIGTTPGKEYRALLLWLASVVLIAFLMSFATFKLLRARVLAASFTSVAPRGFFPSESAGWGWDPVPWPDSRSGLYPVVRRGAGSFMVKACVVDATGREWVLSGFTQIGPKEEVPQMILTANAQLDSIWAWGVARGASAESGRYTPVRLPAREKLRRMAAGTAPGWSGYPGP